MQATLIGGPHNGQMPLLADSATETTELDALGVAHRYSLKATMRTNQPGGGTYTQVYFAHAGLTEDEWVEIMRRRDEQGQ